MQRWAVQERREADAGIGMTCRNCASAEGRAASSGSARSIVVSLVVARRAVSMSSYLVASHYVTPNIQRCMGRTERREADAYRFLYEVQAVCTHVASAQLQASKQELG